MCGANAQSTARHVRRNLDGEAYGFVLVPEQNSLGQKASALNVDSRPNSDGRVSPKRPFSALHEGPPRPGVPSASQRQLQLRLRRLNCCQPVPRVIPREWPGIKLSQRGSSHRRLCPQSAFDPSDPTPTRGVAWLNPVSLGRRRPRPMRQCSAERECDPVRCDQQWISIVRWGPARRQRPADLPQPTKVTMVSSRLPSTNCLHAHRKPTRIWLPLGSSQR